MYDLHAAGQNLCDLLLLLQCAHSESDHCFPFPRKFCQVSVDNYVMKPNVPKDNICHDVRIVCI